MNTPKAEKRTHSEVEADSSPENQVEKRREMATTEVRGGDSIKEQFNSMAHMNKRLQVIENLAVDMSSRLAKLDNIEKLVTTTQSTIEVLSSSIDQVKQLAQTARSEVAKCDRVINQLTVKVKQIDILKEKTIQAEAYSRRDNLVFDGIPEDKEENCEEKILDILVKDLKIQNARQNIKFTRVHRLGGQQTSSHYSEISLFQG